MLRDEQLLLSKSDQFKVGDIVVYHMSEYEKTKASCTSDDVTSRKYGPQWSLPVRVREVQERTLKVQHTLGGRKGSRMVPKSKARRIVSDVPQSLIGQAYESLGFEFPERPKSLGNLCFEAPESPQANGQAVAEEQPNESAKVNESESCVAGSIEKPQKSKRRRVNLLE
eukprot:GHVS01062657.1.p1 GENE.GHVS01062657.1~~GHVS01062657.1.p1  ORF type:complete len:169 (-),score=0.67 GHVS01062657.1:34-540(-)